MNPRLSRFYPPTANAGTDKSASATPRWGSMMRVFRRYSKPTTSVLLCLSMLLPFSLLHAQDTTDSEQVHQDVLLRIADEVTAGNVDVLNEVLADDYVVHSPFGDLGREDMAGFLGALDAALSDFRMVRENMVLQDDFAAMRTVVTGVFEHDFNSATGVLPPNEQPITLEVVNIFHFNAAGLIDEEWAQFDNLGFLTQLGAMPASASTGEEGGITEAMAQRFAQRFDAIFNGPDRPNLDIIDEIFAPDYVGHLPLTPDLDPDGLKAYIGSFYAAMSDLTETVNQVIVAKDRVVVDVTYTGTHDAPLFGIPATGKQVSMHGIGIFRFDATGLVAENWAVIDVAGALAQIGAFPPAPQAVVTKVGLPANAYSGCFVAFGPDNCVPHTH